MGFRQCSSGCPVSGTLRKRLRDVMSLSRLLRVATAANSLSAPEGGLVMRHDQGGSPDPYVGGHASCHPEGGDVPRRAPEDPTHC
jgi:hypothetical protein